MTERRREAYFAAGVGLLLAAGLVLDLTSGDVPPAEAEAGGRGGFEAHSVFCPGAVAGGAADVDLVIVAPEGDRLAVGIEPQEGETAEVPREGALIYDVSGSEPADIVGYGAPAGVAVLTSTERPGAGAGAAGCARTAGANWYFAAGSASLEADERILLYNPFPDEAVVRLSLFTPEGEQTKASLADVAVPANAFTVVPLNEKVGVENTLAVHVAAERGRVVAWRQTFVSGRDRVPGMAFSLGAARPSALWHFPDGAVGGGSSERISILNPSQEEAVVAISLAVGRDEVVAPPDLMELAVPPRSQLVVGLGAHVETGDEPVAVAASVRSVNDVPVVAEREVVVDGAEGRGIAAEVGSSADALRWLVPPAARNSSADAIAILNPATEPATVSLRLLDRNGVEIAAPGLEAVEIGPGGRVRIPVARWTAGKPVLALVDATVPVVVERSAIAAGDAVALMGLPLR
ncbi:MAG TPA: DUF5719 family protein [Actinomycetota bacterium]|nr:DUF5719 family protein [Actinomycetota bacterium]